MRINVMKKGEHFVGLSGDRIILENRKGEVRIVCLEWDKDGVRINPEKEIQIGFGSGTVQIGDMDEGVEITNF